MLTRTPTDRFAQPETVDKWKAEQKKAKQNKDLEHPLSSEPVQTRTEAVGSSRLPFLHKGPSPAAPPWAFSLLGNTAGVSSRWHNSEHASEAPLLRRCAN